MKYCKDCKHLQGTKCNRPSLPISPVSGKPIGSSAIRQRLGYGAYEYDTPPDTQEEQEYLKREHKYWKMYGEYTGHCGLEAKYWEEKPKILEKRVFIEERGGDTPWT